MCSHPPAPRCVAFGGNIWAIPPEWVVAQDTTDQRRDGFSFPVRNRSLQHVWWFKRWFSRSYVWNWIVGDLLDSWLSFGLPWQWTFCTWKWSVAQTMLVESCNMVHYVKIGSSWEIHSYPRFKIVTLTNSNLSLSQGVASLFALPE